MTASRGPFGDSREPVRSGHLRVVRATRASDLAQDLAEQFAPGRAPDLLHECVVVVQGPGMAQWVRTDMVRRLGAWGGMETPFLREFLLGLPERAGMCGGVARGRQPVRELGYRIAASVLSSADRNGPRSASSIEPFLRMCTDVHDVLQPDAVLARAHALAEAFDRYEVDRPDLVEAWAEGRAWQEPSERWTEQAAATEAWQRALWKSVVPGRWAPHEAWCALRALIRRLDAGEVPGRIGEIGLVSVFGVSSLPPLALHALRALAAHVPVHVHMLVPTRAFQSRGEGRRAQVARARAQGVDSASLRQAGDAPERHPLLAALGTASASAAAVIESIDAEVIELEPEIPKPSLLAAVQQGLCLDEPPTLHSHAPDGTLRVHGVASPTRMAEVIHDEILRGFAELPRLRQEEVLVLAPRLDTLAGTLQGVARARAGLHASGAAPSLRVADVAGADRAQVAAAVLRLFDLASEDQPFDRVRALLQSPPCCARAELETSRMESLLDRLEQAGARRFVDAAARARWLGVAHPDDVSHTIEGSIDRLVLGVAAGASDASQCVTGDMLPSGAMPAMESEELHRAMRLVEAIADLSRMVQRGAHSIATWHAAIAVACEAILPSAEHELFGRQRVQADRALAQVAEAAFASGLGALPWPVARAEFESALETLVEGRSFATGGVTLARLTPMRSVPARLLVLAGLDAGVFPRPSRRDALDLTSLCPRVGDRDDRLEDQLLLLESIHAATERLVIVVQDTVAASGQRGPFSPVVEETLASVAAHAGIAPEQARSGLVLHQATLGDQPEAWALDRQAGFDASARARAEAIRAARSGGFERVFATDRDGNGTGPTISIGSVEGLAGVLGNPSRAWLRGQGVQAADLRNELGERCEPVEIDALRRWSLERRAREGVLSRQDPEELLCTLRLEGHLPHGEAGVRAWRRIWEDQANIAPLLAEALGIDSSELSLERIEFTVPALQPELRASTLWCPSCRTQVLFSKVGREKEWLALWPEHLAFALAWPESRCIRIDLPASRSQVARAIVHEPVDVVVARGLLEKLREIAEQAQRRLLPLHGELLHPYCGSAGAETAERLEQLRPKLETSRPKVPAPEAEPWFRLAWRGLDFLSAGRQPGAPRVAGIEPSFVGLADWIGQGMEATGWKIRSGGGGA